MLRMGEIPDSVMKNRQWSYGGEWEYIAKDPKRFFASLVSGVQRLPNGNTLVCNGPSGRFFEVTSEGQIVWEYVNPVEPKIVFRAERYPIEYPGIKNFLK
ncbi:hypothetical protein ACFL6U_04615 [Planctomycetota bacterium]